MTSAPITKAFSEGISAAIPEGDLTVSGWADTYRYVSQSRSARYGKWRTEVVPYAKAIMDAASNPVVHKIVFWKSSQVAGTEIANNIIGYFMHIKPSGILYAGETEGKTRAWAKESFQPMIRDTPVLAGLIKETGNTIEEKDFPGGHLALGWATSAATLSSRPCRVVIMDEVDAFESNKEGDPVTQAEARTNSFEEDYLLVLISTPRLEETSKIKPAYESCSAQGKYFVPCPHCGEFQLIEFGRIVYENDDPDTAHMICVKGCRIDQADKAEMLARGEWRYKGKLKDSVGFFIWEGYSPFVSWSRLISKWLDKKRSIDGMQAFINTSLAETWQQFGQTQSIQDLTSRCEHYEAEVPDGVLLLTAGVDVQGDRLEYEILGWGLDKESWSIMRGKIFGDPASREVWDDLQLALVKGYLDSTGLPRRVRIACIDTGGHHTDEAVAFCRRNKSRRFYAVKGASTPGRPIIPKKPSKIGKPPVDLWLIGTETAKDTLAANLKLIDQGPGYCHFPIIEDEKSQPVYDEDYFKQLRSEIAVINRKRGVAVRVWQKIKPSARNEALDLRVYNMAAFSILNPDLEAYAKRQIQARAEPAPQNRPLSQPYNETETPSAQEQRKKTARQKMPRFSFPRGNKFGPNWRGR